MNTSRKLIVVMSLLAGSIAMAATDGITLRKTLKTGTEAYHITAKSNQLISIPGGGGDQELDTTSTSAFTLKIGTVAADGTSAPLDLITKTEKFDMTGPMADMMQGNKDQFMKSMTISGTIDNRNRFTPDPKAKTDPMSVLSGSMNSTVVGVMVELPEKAVNIGDTWDVTIKKSPMTGKKDQTLTAKLTGEDTVDGAGVYVVAITGTINTDIDFAELVKNAGSADLGPLGQMEMQIKGSIEVKGEAQIDKATGQTVSMKVKLTTKQDMQVAGQSIPSTGTSNITITKDK